MPNETGPVDEGIGLASAIEAIRADLLAARASGEDGDIRFPIGSVTVELRVVATKGRDGRAGFRVPFVNMELGGSANRELQNSSTVTIVLGAPVDRAGQPVKIAEGSAQLKG